MRLKNRGYAGKILYLDLSSGEKKIEELSEKPAYNLLGGKGLGALILYNQLKAHTNPLSKENLHIFATGPLTGTIAPGSGKFAVITKSPATGTFLDSYSGGNFGVFLKYAGFDALVIKGKAKVPSILIIDNDKIELREAKHLWGKLTFDTNKVLEKEVGREFSPVVIGPAGERLSPISGILCGTRIAGRGGGGGVMGSKLLKAICVKGTGGIKVHNQEEFQKYVQVALRSLRMSSAIERLKQMGTVSILEFIQSSGALPTRNFQRGEFKEAEKLYGESWKKEAWEKDKACPFCPISCSKITSIKEGPYKGAKLDGPDYETIFGLGTNCGVSDKQAIIEANYLCDLYGVDTISCGGIIGFIIELKEKGIISKHDLDGLEVKWGAQKALVRLTEKICQGEGVGKVLEQGVRALSKRYPQGRSFAMEVKGLELPAYHPQAAKGTALAYALSERGACHLRGAPLGELLGAADPLTIEGKAELFKTKQADLAVIDSSVHCYFTDFGMTLKEVFQMIVPATGFNYQEPKDLAEVGERISTLCRLFNLREGLRSTDDTLPERCLKEPLPSGPAQGEVVELKPMLLEYYKLMGWDEQGIPKSEQIKKLHLNELIPGLK